MTDNDDVSGTDTSTEEVDQLDTPEGTPEGWDPESDQDHETDTFTRDYVEGLRQENAKYRQRAARADELAQRLHTELVRATGRLADPSDLAFDEAHLEVSDNLSRAIDELLTRKPHLATRRPSGEIGQGAARAGSTVDLAAILRGNA
jgi:hypothetical protein